MKIKDIRKALSSVLATKTGLKVFVDDINTITRPCLNLKLIDTNRTFISKYREYQEYSFDIIYLPTSSLESKNAEIHDMLDTINMAFEVNGVKRLTVKEYDSQAINTGWTPRVITIGNTTQNITENIGHYIVDLKLYVDYGDSSKEYEDYVLMQELLGLETIEY